MTLGAVQESAHAADLEALLAVASPALKDSEVVAAEEETDDVADGNSVVQQDSQSWSLAVSAAFGYLEKVDDSALHLVDRVPAAFVKAVSDAVLV